MKWPIAMFVLAISVSASRGEVIDKTPYEFGFTIKGQQHRHERKDANGIISGDFGFVTGDGSYHQAKYATDENGKFKLLSSKSSYRRNKSNEPNTVSGIPTRVEVIAPQKSPVAAVSCSSCKRVEKITDAVHKEAVKQINSIKESVNIVPKSQTQSKPLVAPKVNLVNENLQKTPTASPKPVSAVTKPVADQPIQPKQPLAAQAIITQAKPKPTTNATPTNSPTTSSIPKTTKKSVRPYDVVSTVAGNQKSAISDFTNSKIPSAPLPTSNTPIITKSEISPPPQVSVKSTPPTIAVKRTPTAVTVKPTPAAIAIKPPSPPVSNLKANVKPIATVPTARITDNKPPVAAMPQLLKAMNAFLTELVYRFNYTTTFNGHNEEGSRSGNKAGAYFSIGRDNVRRTVQYTANENGFQPHVIYELVNPAEAPSELTDKSGILKGFEFKWFNAQTSRRR